MVHPPQMHQLVQKYVVPDVWRHQHQSPVETDVPIASARAPARPLVPDADPRHDQAVCGGKLQKSWRQLTPRPRTLGTAIARGIGRHRQTCALPCDPIRVMRNKRVGLATGAAARNRDAYGPVCVHAQNIPASATVTDEIDG
jgi:hypothetical protein